MDGLLVINPRMMSVLKHVTIFVTASQSYKQIPATNGMIIFNYFQTNFNRLFIKKLTYRQQFCHITGNENVFYIAFLHNKRIEVYISDAVIKDLCNCIIIMIQ